MRIAYLSTFYPYRGGIAQFNASLYRALEKKHEIKAFTFARQYPGMLFPGKTQLVENDETADQIPAARMLDSINPFTYWQTARKINEFSPDLLIMKYWMSFLAPSLGTAA
ncbi:MAG TPA: glycosyl transferase, partial [Bacteroidales bacterium]|nr:glycosyl transferase [Bacteroidales bacterium]